MKTLVESIFGDNIANNPVVTSLKTAGQLTMDSIKKDIHDKNLTVTVMTKDSIIAKEKDVWKRDKWILAYLELEGFDNVTIYLQYNKPYTLDGYAEEDIYSIRLTIRITQSQTDNELISINDIDCEIFRDLDYLDYQIGSAYKFGDIEKYTGLKNRYFNKNTLGISKYFGKLFSDFKKGVSEGDFNEVFKYLYLHNHGTGWSYEREASQNLNKVFNKLVK